MHGLTHHLWKFNADKSNERVSIEKGFFFIFPFFFLNGKPGIVMIHYNLTYIGTGRWISNQKASDTAKFGICFFHEAA